LLEIEEIKQRGIPWIQAATWHSDGQRLKLRPLDSNRWRARGEQQADEGTSAVDGRNMFCLLESTIRFIHASSFYFDQELLQYRLQ
jgi:hypothetical protein